MNRASLPPTPYPLHPGRSRPWFILPAFLFAIGLGFALPKEARADPHAVFYTDKGQEQVFYNVLAALNQADYVEPPGQPPIKQIRKLGDEIQQTTGENERVPFPRIRVRQVTSDDGDAFFREELWRRGDEIYAKKNVGETTCAVLRIILGRLATEKDCPEKHS